jgi:hypoxanthine phosphoribosyltransferase
MEKKLKLIIAPDEIRLMVEDIAGKIRTRFPSGRPVLVGVLKGAAVFLADLTRAIGAPLEVDFIQASSYGESETPSNKVIITGDTSIELRGRDVIVVDGIVDRGKTARGVMAHLKTKEPASLGFCTLLLRDGAEGIDIDYVGRIIPDGFIVGYGMDHNEDYRWLDGIYLLTPTNDKGSA